jgi:hypothetical protein
MSDAFHYFLFIYFYLLYNLLQINLKNQESSFILSTFSNIYFITFLSTSSYGFLQLFSGNIIFLSSKVFYFPSIVNPRYYPYKFAAMTISGNFISAFSNKSGLN